MPPASPHVAITVRRFGKRTFSPQQLVEIGSLTPELLDVARETLAGRGNILVSGGTGSGKTTLLNALIELLPANERIVSIEDTLELRIDHPNSVRFEARELGSGGVTIRDLVKHSLRLSATEQRSKEVILLRVRHNMTALPKLIGHLHGALVL